VAVLFALGIAAQQNPAEAPADKEDIKRYFDVMHSREMMTQMIHEQFLKEKDKLPADFETRMNHVMDDRMKSPWDDILQSMVPVYQKHLTKGDIDAMVAFYSGPTGQKLLREMPAITAEAMQSMMPLLQKQLDSLNERMRQEIAAMLKQPSDTQGRKAPPVSN
jgi:hypothetical protein